MELTNMVRRLPILLLAVCVASALQTPAPPPTFSTGTKLVEVDVVAHRGDRPADNLTKDDFTLFDNGVEQRISVFSVRSSKGPTGPKIPLPPGAVSNRVNRDGEPPATATVIILDQVFTTPDDQHYANSKVVKFLEKRGNRDRIGIYAFSYSGVHIIQELTEDP